MADHERLEGVDEEDMLKVKCGGIGLKNASPGQSDSIRESKATTSGPNGQGLTDDVDHSLRFLRWHGKENKHRTAAHEVGTSNKVETKLSEELASMMRDKHKVDTEREMKERFRASPNPSRQWAGWVGKTQWPNLKAEGRKEKTPTPKEQDAEAESEVYLDGLLASRKRP